MARVARESVRLKLDIPFLRPHMNAGVFHTRLENGDLEECVGADGRTVGSIRNFPGFRRITKLDLYIGGKYHTVNAFFPFDLPNPNYPTYAGKRHDGYIVRAGNLILMFFRTPTGAWARTTLAAGDSTRLIDMTQLSHLGIIVEYGSSNRGIVFFDSSADPETWTGYDYLYRGDWETPPQALKVYSAAETGGYLRYGRYRVAYRYTKSWAGGLRRGNLSEPITYEFSNRNVRNGLINVVTRGYLSPPRPEGWEEVEIYRTISTEVAGSVYEGGVFYLERTLTHNEWWAAHHVHPFDPAVPIPVGTTPDEVLVQGRRYDPIADAFTAPPAMSAVGAMQDILFGEKEQSRYLVWSNMRELQIDNFPAVNAYPIPPEVGKLLKIVKAEDALYAFCGSGILRVYSAGDRIIVQKITDSLGLASKHCVAPIGSDLVFMSTKGLAVLNGSTGEIYGVSDSKRIVEEFRWNEATNLWAATDGLLGCTFILGGDYPGATSEEEKGDGAMVIWHDTKAFNMLVGMGQFVACGTGPEVDDGEGSVRPNRAHFITRDGIVVVPETNIRSGTPTMLGVSGTLNGITE